jgi:hypothetical protein
MQCFHSGGNRWRAKGVGEEQRIAKEFIRDVDTLLDKILVGLSDEEQEKIVNIREDLLLKYGRNEVKINHSVMELICAMHLVRNGFDVNLEYSLNSLSTDVYAQKGYGSLIVEVETGFVPPDHALDPTNYLRGRIASKITRYSSFANKFVLASPIHYIMQIPPSLTKPPRFRTYEEVEQLKVLCDTYYSNPPVTKEEIRNARLHSVYVVDVDNVDIREWEVNEYMGKAALWSV